MADYEALMIQARAHNDQLDAIEHEYGFASPGDLIDGNTRHSAQKNARNLMLTVMMAIKAGIVTDDWTCIAEAQAMLEQLMGKPLPEALQ